MRHWLEIQIEEAADFAVYHSPAGGPLSGRWIAALGAVLCASSPSWPGTKIDLPSTDTALADNQDRNAQPANFGCGAAASHFFMNDDQERTMDSMLTKADMAAKLKCTRRYVNTLMRRGILPYYKTRGLLRFDPVECDRALKLFKHGSLFAESPAPRQVLLPPTRLTNVAKPPESSPGPATPEVGSIGSLAQADGQIVHTRVFFSLVAARNYLAGLAGADATAEGGQSHKKGTPVTVIILQPAPVA